VGFGCRQSRKTMEGLLRQIRGYLGYARAQLGTPAHALSLSCFADLQHYFHYLSFLVFVRKQTGQETKAHITTATRLLTWMALTATESGEARSLLSKAEHLKAMGHTLYKLAKSREGAAMRQPQPLPNPMELMQWGLRLRDEALRAARAHLAHAPRLNKALALFCRDALLFSFLYGPLGASRPSSLLCCTSPALHPDTACARVDCTVPGCKGNRVLKEQSGQHRMQLPHHKNQHRGGAAPNMLITEQQLNSLMDLYVAHARPVLCVDDNNHCLFLNDNGELHACTADNNNTNIALSSSSSCDLAVI